MSCELDSNATALFAAVVSSTRIPVYAKQGPKALEDWLNDQGVKNINNVNARLKAAKPWFSFYGASSAAALAD